jgi:hypothetical protein
MDNPCALKNINAIDVQNSTMQPMDIISNIVIHVIIERIIWWISTIIDKKSWMKVDIHGWKN